MNTKPTIRIFLREPVCKVMESSIVSTQIEQGLNPSMKAISKVLRKSDCSERLTSPRSGILIVRFSVGAGVGAAVALVEGVLASVVMLVGVRAVWVGCCGLNWAKSSAPIS